MTMDLEKRARRQSFRIIFSEVVMVLTVIIMVAILALVVSGYWLNSDFEVERQGMLQVYSIPTGANVEVDGDAPWFQRTNTSKILSSGEHTVTLTKDGYDSWSKTINISEGLLYRLHYPHLFLKEREKETVYNATTTTFATVSPNRKLLLLANNTTDWSLLNLDADTMKPTTLDIAKVFSIEKTPGDEQPSLFAGEIISADWDRANEHVLLQVALNDSIEWALLNIKDVSNSVNLTREFAANFSNIRIFDNSASNLLAIRDGNLHKIDVLARQISAILAENVANFDFYESDIIFASGTDVSTLKIGDTPSVIKTTDVPAQVFVGKFYETNYIFVITENTISVYQKDDLAEIFTAALDFAPQKVKIGHDGEFVVMSSDTNIASLDMESMTIRNWTTNSPDFGWINNYMIYSVKDGDLRVYDFDGLNQRQLAENVSGHFPVTITNDKWLYYFSDNQIIREWLIAR